MRLGEALATCPRLVLVDPDPAAAEQAWEETVRSLEDAGFAVDPAAAGVAYFDTRGVERLYGGLEPALRRALGAVGAAWDARLGAAGRRFAALAAASVAKPGQLLVVRDEEVGRFLAPLPLTLLPLDRQRHEELESLGVRRLGQLAGLPGGAVAERLGPDGRRAWSLARGGAAARVRGRRPPAELAETLAFPEAVANELTLRRALGALIETALGRPERRDRFVRKVALGARPGAHRRRAQRGQSPAGRRAARGVAGARPLVDGGAGAAPLLRGRARERREHRRLPRRLTWRMVHPARRVIGARRPRDRPHPGSRARPRHRARPPPRPPRRCRGRCRRSRTTGSSRAPRPRARARARPRPIPSSSASRTPRRRRDSRRPRPRPAALASRSKDRRGAPRRRGHVRPRPTRPTGRRARRRRGTLRRARGGR